jgi:hypothetical protein
MATFTQTQWKRIVAELDTDEDGYGLPERRSGSLVFSSFNIRKFGRLRSGSKIRRSPGSWDLLQRYSERCDFIAIQEVLDDVSSLMHLKERLGAKYEVVLSDTAGGVPGRRGSRERLAFLYRGDRIKHTGLASDISFERSAVVETLYDNKDDFTEAFTTRAADLVAWDAKNVKRLAAGKKKANKPPFVLPHFLQFIRTPHIASFEVKGVGQAEPYRFLATNAHLLYGHARKQREERWMEFKALLAWLLNRATELDRVFEPNLFLFGDLNLDLKNVDRRREAVNKFLKSINESQLDDNREKINLPFLDAHPDQAGAVFRTNARRNQTYDQIGFIAGDKRLPPPHENGAAGQGRKDDFDFGMFDFVRLFLNAVPAATKANNKPNYSLFEHDVSDHMPIWIRLQKPKVGQRTFRWR